MTPRVSFEGGDVVLRFPLADLHGAVMEARRAYDAKVDAAERSGKPGSIAYLRPGEEVPPEPVRCSVCSDGATACVCRGYALAPGGRP